MPAEFLRDVAVSGRSIPGRRISMLPVSIAAHACAAIAVFVIPLAAEIDLPTPMHRLAEYMAARPVPQPPPAAPLRTAERTPPPAGAGAPRTAPLDILPERPHEAVVVPDAMAVEGGLGYGVTSGTGFGVSVPVEPPPPAPSAAPERPGLVRPGAVIREPRKILNVDPAYPPLARAGGVEGVVILEAVINVRGEVERLRVLRSIPLLDAAAIDAVRRWRYTPTLLNGEPTPVLITITVRFTLH